MPKPAFRYTHYDLGNLRAGTVIEVTLSAVCNVRLMSPWNFQAFKEVLKHQFIGGVARRSPIKLTIPETGPWHLVVDMEGQHGLAESSVKMIDSVNPARYQPAEPAAG